MPQVFRIGSYWVYSFNSKKPAKALRNIMRTIESRSAEITAKWLDYFGSVSLFC